MRPDSVVVLALFLDKHLGLPERIEDLTVEQLVSLQSTARPLRFSISTCSIKHIGHVPPSVMSSGPSGSSQRIPRAATCPMSGQVTLPHKPLDVVLDRVAAYPSCSSGLADCHPPMLAHELKNPHR